MFFSTSCNLGMNSRFNWLLSILKVTISLLIFSQLYFYRTIRSIPCCRAPTTGRGTPQSSRCGLRSPVASSRPPCGGAAWCSRRAPAPARRSPSRPGGQPPGRVGGSTDGGSQEASGGGRPDGEAGGGSRRTSGSGPARRSPSWPAPRSRWVAADREPGCCQGYLGLVVGFDILVGLPGRMGHFVWDWADLILWAVAYAGQD